MEIPLCLLPLIDNSHNKIPGNPIRGKLIQEGHNYTVIIVKDLATQLISALIFMDILIDLKVEVEASMDFPKAAGHIAPR